MIHTILLKGYYGFGNFGDDLLFIVSWHWLRATFPEATITVCTESLHAGYLGGLVGEKINVVRNEETYHADLIFHGGGGTYFDFQKGPPIFHLWNSLVRLLGPALFRNLYNAVQKRRGRNRIHGRLRVGVGIGIGNYTLTSRRLPFHTVELSEFNLLAVRDPESKRLAERMRIPTKLVMASDLVFLSSSWKPPALPARIPGKIGIVLRDWPYDKHAHLHAVAEAIDALSGNGRTFRFFSFDAIDKEYEKRFASTGEWYPWYPDRTPVHEYLSSIAVCDTVISSRAHGVLVAACLGIPVVCLEIEPKLAAVAEMVPHSAILVRAPFNFESVVNAVSSLHPLIEQSMRNDVEENAAKVLAALDRVSELAAGL